MADPSEIRCPVCGVSKQADCAGDEGYGCPWWEDFKEREQIATPLTKDAGK